MTNKTETRKTSPAKAEAVAVLTTLESEGSALAVLYRKEQSSLKRNFKRSIASDGLDYRLGLLMATLSAEAEDGRIKSVRLAQVGIANIDKRRRAEALWFYQNHTECEVYIKASKKGFTSLTALQAAMRKAAKAEAKEQSNVGPNTESEVTESEVTESVVTESVATVESIVAYVLANAKENNVSLLEIAEALLEADSDKLDIAA